MSRLAGTISFFWASRFLASLSRIEESCSSDGSGSRASFLRYLCDLLLKILTVLLRWYFDEFREDVHAAILVS